MAMATPPRQMAERRDSDPTRPAQRHWDGEEWTHHFLAPLSQQPVTQPHRRTRLPRIRTGPARG
jgi:Protein of unknown function (DUF2510)